MQRADRDIDELLGTLHGTFQRLRQTSIDEELFDVVSGFDALSNEGPKPVVYRDAARLSMARARAGGAH